MGRFPFRSRSMPPAPSGRAVGTIPTDHLTASVEAAPSAASGGQNGYVDAHLRGRAEFQAVFDLKREWSADGKPRWLEVMNASSTETVRRGYWGADYSTQGACRPRAGYQLWQPLPQSEISANQMIKQNAGW